MGALFSGSITGLRSWPLKGFEPIRIYYVEVPGCLRVVRVLHGKRNVRRIFFIPGTQSFNKNSFNPSLSIPIFVLTFPLAN